MGCLSEIERLGKLMINGAQPELGPFGTLNISDISVPLKREFINSNINGSGLCTAQLFDFDLYLI